MSQWSVIRMAIAENRDLADLMTAGLHGQRSLDAADQLRLEQFLGEQLWAAFHIWDREQRGVFAKGTHEWSAGRYIAPLLATTRGAAWWHAASRGFLPPYVAVVDAVAHSAATESRSEKQAKMTSGQSGASSSLRIALIKVFSSAHLVSLFALAAWWPAKQAAAPIAPPPRTTPTTDPEKVLNVYNWTDYIAPDIVPAP
jgi:hypothetical protein